MREKGISFNLSSVQMVTSVEMLEDFYRNFKVSDNANKVAGHERPVEKNQQTEKKKIFIIKKLLETNAKQAEQTKILLEKLTTKQDSNLERILA